MMPNKTIARYARLLVLGALLALPLAGPAQPPVTGLGNKPLGGGRQERVEAMRAAYISRYVDLTAEESQKFWPIYNEYHAELDKNKKDLAMDVFEARLNWDKMTDNEVEKTLDQMMQRQYETIEIKKRYHEKFKRILPIRKVALLYQAETQFLKELVKLLGNNPNPGLRRNNPGN
jgi:Spy/CpxP family protein refolding chaperone